MSSGNLRLDQLYADLDNSMLQLRQKHEPVRKSRKIVEHALQDGKAHYGINTGFGVLANKRISSEDLAVLQKNILLSHACGLGDPIPPEITRLMLQLKIHSLSLGYSGVSEQTFMQLLKLEEQGVLPWIPSRGSVGASGDLAPLAHMCLPLIGRGEVWDETLSKRVPSADTLASKGIEPINLQAKDGLALINGTQMMAAYGAYVLERTLGLQREADLLAAMSLEALQGSAAPFDERIHAIRPHHGQQIVASNIRKLLEGSEILASHRDCGKVQDPYSLRCVPQVHGASRDALDYSRQCIEVELNSVTDNPLVFEQGDILSGGNFHGQPLALAMDFAAIALAELGSISERRTYLLLEGHDGLPKLLMQDTGVNSGFMIPQYTAAALVSENKILCHPASVDSIPTSLGQEDHVSMGSISAFKLLSVLKNVERILAVELLTSAQALDFRSAFAPGHGVSLAHKALRTEIGHADQDYEVRNDLNQCVAILRSGALLKAVENELGPLKSAEIVTVLRNIGQLATCPVDAAQQDAGLIENAALVIEDKKIVWVGSELQLPESSIDHESIDCGQRLVIPGLIDCHTHLCFGGWRGDEFEMRLQGRSYQDIAAAGGGIRSTVVATRADSAEKLLEKALYSLEGILDLGITTLECKSGYGLEQDAELKQLRVYRQLGELQPVELVPTFLGAHMVPDEYQHDREAYIRLLCKVLIPEIGEQKLARFCDVFVEKGAFSLKEATTILTAARLAGLGLKVHADQLSNGGGAQLASSLGAVSAEHLEYADADGIKALAETGTVAVSLPLASLYLCERYLPAREMLDAGVRVAVATDFNPGSAPSYHLPLAMTLACLNQKMTPQEVIMGATTVAAQAISAEQYIGSLLPGFAADIAIIDAPSVNHWLYHFRANACCGVIKSGKWVRRLF